MGVLFPEICHFHRIHGLNILARGSRYIFQYILDEPAPIHVAFLCISFVSLSLHGTPRMVAGTMFLALSHCLQIGQIHLDSLISILSPHYFD